MAKFYGVIGYAVTEEVVQDVWQEQIKERPYSGDVTRNTKRWNTGQSLNDNLDVSNTISIIADPFAFENFFAIRYIVWMGAKWKVTNVEVQYPRLILSIGGVYNGIEN